MADIAKKLPLCHYSIISSVRAEGTEREDITDIGVLVVSEEVGFQRLKRDVLGIIIDKAGTVRGKTREEQGDNKHWMDACAFYLAGQAVLIRNGAQVSLSTLAALSKNAPPAIRYSWPVSVHADPSELLESLMKPLAVPEK